MMKMREPDRYDYKTREEYEKAVEEFKKYERKKKMNAVVGVGAAVMIGLVSLTVVGGSWYTVGEGYRGVALRNGAVIGTSEPGLGFKMPVIDSVVDISIQSQAQMYENVLAYSRDQQTAALNLSVNYRLPADQVETIYREYGGEAGVVSRLLDRQVLEEVKNVFGKFNAATAIQERERLAAEVQMAIQKAVVGPIIVESVQIENIDFSDAYENSIEQRMLAEVEVQKVKQNAEREKVTAEITVIQAQAEADAQLARATAEAEAIQIRGEAEASAIRARGEALRDNPSLVDLVQAERWNGALPTTMVPGSTVPFMNVGNTTGQ
jgi:regulator of protease activity HflC (stomatin/prohibitin superfamily)